MNPPPLCFFESNEEDGVLLVIDDITEPFHSPEVLCADLILFIVWKAHIMPEIGQDGFFTLDYLSSGYIVGWKIREVVCDQMQYRPRGRPNEIKREILQWFKLHLLYPLPRKAVVTKGYHMRE